VLLAQVWSAAQKTPLGVQAIRGPPSDAPL